MNMYPETHKETKEIVLCTAHECSCSMHSKSPHALRLRRQSVLTRKLQVRIHAVTFFDICFSCSFLCCYLVYVLLFQYEFESIWVHWQMWMDYIGKEAFSRHVEFRETKIYILLEWENMFEKFRRLLKFEVLTEVNVEIKVFWVVMSFCK
jgi:hypothetical protein